MAESSQSTPKAYSLDPTLYLYTSLTAGSSHIVTATSRLETILKANRIPFKALDVATDEKARMLWGRRSGKDESGRARKLPGLVQEGLVLGDIVEVEDWNEYGELKQHIKIVPLDGTGTPTKPAAAQASPDTPSKPSKATTDTAIADPVSTILGTSKSPDSPTTGTKAETTQSTASVGIDTLASTASSGMGTLASAMKQAADEAAQKAKDTKKKALEALAAGTSKSSDSTTTTVSEPAAATPESTSKVSTQESASKDEDPSRRTAIPPSLHTQKPISLPDRTRDPSRIHTQTLQSPTTTAWKSTPSSSSSQTVQTDVGTASSAPLHPFIEPMQSPNSTAWKTSDTFDPPMRTYRGGSISEASAEEIKKIEDSLKITEEDEGEGDEEGGSALLQEEGEGKTEAGAGAGTKWS